MENVYTLRTINRWKLIRNGWSQIGQKARDIGKVSAVILGRIILQDTYSFRSPL